MSHPKQMIFNLIFASAMLFGGPKSRADQDSLNAIYQIKDVLRSDVLKYDPTPEQIRKAGYNLLDGDPAWRNLQFIFTAPIPLSMTGTTLQGGKPIERSKVDPGQPLCVFHLNLLGEDTIKREPPDSDGQWHEPSRAEVGSNAFVDVKHVGQRVERKGNVDTGDVKFFLGGGPSYFYDVDCHAAPGHAIQPADVEHAVGTYVRLNHGDPKKLLGAPLADSGQDSVNPRADKGGDLTLSSGTANSGGNAKKGQ